MRNSANLIERHKGEIKHLINAVGIFSCNVAVVVGILVLEQNDERTLQRARYLTLQASASWAKVTVISLPAVAR